MNTRRQFLHDVIRAGAATMVAPLVLSAQSRVPDQWQLGCFTRPWVAFDYRIAFDDIAAAGFKYVGLMSTKNEARLVLHVKSTMDDASKVAQEARSRGLGIPVVWGGDFSIPQSTTSGISELRHLIDLCATAGAKTLLLGGVASPKLYDTYFNAVSECCDYAAQKNVALTMKPHGGVNSTGSQLRKTIERVRKKNFTVWYDAGNIFYYSDGKRDPVEDADTVAGLVTGWCIKDFTSQPKKSVDLTPGTGSVNFKAVLARLKSGGFTHGPLVVETLTPGDRPQLVQQAIKARRLLEELIARG